MKDLHVPDVSVCDSLIAEGFLSGDDCQVLNKTKRNKSKVKRLISILCKSDDPKSAFHALSKCVEKTHSHLVKCIHKAIERYPEPDINSNVCLSGIEHDESGCISKTEIQNHCRQPVQHDETNGSVDVSNQCPNHVAIPISASGDLNEYSKIRDANLLLRAVTLNDNAQTVEASRGHLSQVPLDNNWKAFCNNYTYSNDFQNAVSLQNNNYASSEAYDAFKSLHQHCRGEAQCTDNSQDARVSIKPSSLESRQCQDDYGYKYENFSNCKNSSYSSYYSQGFDDVDGCLIDTGYTSTENAYDAIDGAVGLSNEIHQPSDKLFNLSSSKPENTEAEPIRYVAGQNSAKTEHLSLNTSVKANSDIDSLSSRTSVTSENKYCNLPYIPSTKCHTDQAGSVLDEHTTTKSQYLNKSDQTLCATEIYPVDFTQDQNSSRCRFRSAVLSESDGLDNQNYECDSSSDSKTRLQSQFLNSSQTNTSRNVDDDSEARGAHLYINTDNRSVVINKTECFPTNQDCGNIKKLDSVSSLHADCPEDVTYRLKESVRISNCKLEPNSNTGETNQSDVGKTDKITVALKPSSKNPRAHSQIDYCSSVVTNQCVNRAQSWAYTRSRSRVFDGFTSSSEDYTTTELNYSDLNEIEQELCDELIKTGSITDIVDRLIEEEYFSNDDWSAINEIEVKHKQATYVAKRISNIVKSDGCQSFSKLLKSQPKLYTWLSSKFLNSREDTSEDDNSCKAKSERVVAVESSCVNSTVSNICNLDFGSNSIPDSCNRSFEDKNTANLTLAVYRPEQKPKNICARPDVLCSADIVVDKHFQKVFDTLNTEFNKGTLPVTKLPRDPNAKCIVLYLKACDALYKSNNEDAEKFIKLADAAINDTDCPLFMRSEIFTQKTWLCLRTNRLGIMEKLLEENEQFLLANPNLWSNKAVGWFYYDYGRYNFTMMKVTQPSRPQRRKSIKTVPKTAFDIYQEKAKKCLRKSIEYFLHSDSSDGPIGMGFAISLLASIELQCTTEDSFFNVSVDEANLKEADKLLQTVKNLFDEIPGILKATYLLSKSELCFRRKELTAAKSHVEDCISLSTELDLKEELKDGEKKRRIYNQYA